MAASLASLDAADAPPKVMRLESEVVLAPPAAHAPQVAAAAAAAASVVAGSSSSVVGAAASLPPLSQITIELQASIWNALPLEVRKPLPADGTLIVLQSGALECFLSSGVGEASRPKLELLLRCEHGTWILIERIVKPDGKVLMLSVQSLATALAKQPTPYKLDMDASHFDLQALMVGPGSPAWGAKQGMTFQPSIVYDTTRDEAYLHITFAKST